ncbi:hypothetical protein L916_00513 [Phytophthora nicotianae]|uniref:FYVE-type domain-containing protein n=1 Tax=Phytophthora nicotianae TaxID=4792 RepID=W2JUZ2_PHYNI|nr:hypothetical protein L916_00513 [Phytophthora nicotianae]
MVKQLHDSRLSGRVGMLDSLSHTRDSVCLGPSCSDQILCRHANGSARICFNCAGRSINHFATCLVARKPHRVPSMARSRSRSRSRDFPLPRDMLPDISIPYHDYVACKDLSSRLLAHTVRAFEHFAYDRLGEVDTRFWKTQALRDELTVYRERQAGRVSESLGDSLHRCAASSSLFSTTPAAITPATMMLTGVRHGYVENAVSTLVTKSQEELALVIRYLHGSSSDCGILHVMEPSTDDDPFHFFGFKYYVSQAVGDPRICKRRHCVYLEDSGFTRTRTGEKLGYHIMHSVNLSQFPDLRSRNSIPALMSTRFLYRQREQGIVEVFMLGNIDIKGLVVKPISLHYAVETVLNMTRLLDCSETKRLTQMAREFLWRRKQERRWGDSPTHADNDPNTCSRCQRVGKDGGVGTLNVVECLVCGRAACSRCRASKQVFVSSQDGLMGRLIMVPVCTGCISEANTSFFDVLRSQRRGRARSTRCGRQTLDYRSPKTRRRGGSSRGMNVAMRSPSVDRRQRSAAHWKDDKMPSTPETQQSSPGPYSTRQSWVTTPRGTEMIRLTPREATITIEERKPVIRSRSKPPPVPRGPPQLHRYQSG